MSGPGSSGSLRIRALRGESRHEEAQALAVQLAAADPQDAELQFEAACVHDYLGLEAAAVPYYVAALKCGQLGAALRREALLGLGSTYRTLGRYAEAEATLRQGRAEFPEARELQVFLAMAMHNLGKGKDAVELLLRIVAATSSDPDIQTYRRAIQLYAEDVDKVWP